jgi:DNA adenine methylase
LSVKTRVPHPIPYQGSKRLLAARILAHAPTGFDRMIEPFAGSAAITLAAAATGSARRFVIGDSLAPLAELWRRIVSEPVRVAARYRRIWKAQLADPRGHFLSVRARYNRTRDEVLLLFLLARCVKAAVRFNARGEFNQSADHRRRGMHPNRMGKELSGAARLLAGRTRVVPGDYAVLCAEATPADLVYLDPPYQGVSEGRDPRYAEPLALARLVANSPSSISAGFRICFPSTVAAVSGDMVSLSRRRSISSTYNFEPVRPRRRPWRGDEQSRWNRCIFPHLCVTGCHRRHLGLSARSVDI